MALQLFPSVAGLAWHVHDSSTLKEKFDTLVANDKDLSGNKDTLDRQVPTQWNSDLTCLDAHLYFRSPVEQLTGAAINKLQAYQLSEDQWDLAETLSAVLEVFDGPTKLFSQSQVPLIAEVIPMLDSIEQSITLVHDDEESELPNVVCVAAQAVLLLINKYYTLMKDCELYIIAIGKFMCPDKKLKWFKDHGQTEAQIQDIKKMVIEHWDKTYKGEDS
ncbi:hypothetical protein L208DRAFT_1561799, partial [Tricholoma matsutake]